MSVCLSECPVGSQHGFCVRQTLFELNRVNTLCRRSHNPVCKKWDNTGCYNWFSIQPLY